MKGMGRNKSVELRDEPRGNGEWTEMTMGSYKGPVETYLCHRPSFSGVQEARCMIFREAVVVPSARLTRSRERSAPADTMSGVQPRQGERSARNRRGFMHK